MRKLVDGGAPLKAGRQSLNTVNPMGVSPQIFSYSVEVIFISEELGKENNRNCKVAVYPDLRESDREVEVFDIKDLQYIKRDL